MSRFVSAGTAEDPPTRDEDWLQAQQDLDDARRRKEEESRQTDGKSLFEVLQANKGKPLPTSIPNYIIFTTDMTGLPS